MGEQKRGPKEIQVHRHIIDVSNRTIKLINGLEEKIDDLRESFVMGKAIRAAGEAAKGLLSTKPVAIAILTVIGLYTGRFFIGKGQEAAMEATSGIFGSIFESVAGEEGRLAWETGFRKALDFWKRIPGFGAVIP